MTERTPGMSTPGLPDLLGALSGATGGSTRTQGQAPGPDQAQCSRKGCRGAAAWRLEWNNPRLHTPDRRKTWLACAEHRDWLTDYLQSRGLLKDVLPLDAPEGRA